MKHIFLGSFTKQVWYIPNNSSKTISSSKRFPWFQQLKIENICGTLWNTAGRRKTCRSVTVKDFLKPRKAKILLNRSNEQSFVRSDITLSLCPSKNGQHERTYTTSKDFLQEKQNPDQYLSTSRTDWKIYVKHNKSRLYKKFIKYALLLFQGFGGILTTSVLSAIN